MKKRCEKHRAEGFEIGEAASSTECTGLLSALPPDDGEAAQVLALCGVQPPMSPKGKKGSE